jgi:hypothetical protein
MITGFGVAVLVYGPIGTPTHQLSGSTLGAPPKGVFFGNAQEALASGLNLFNATGLGFNWNWTNGTGQFAGPCNASGTLNTTTGLYIYQTNATQADNISGGGGSTTLVCLNSVGVVTNATGTFNDTLNATWYYNNNSTTQFTFNSYNSTNWYANGSFYNSTFGNISSCSQWDNPANPANAFNDSVWNATHINNGNFTPCQTYYEMNNNVTYLPSFGATLNATGTGLNNTTLWSPGQFGYAPSDVVYEVPVIFTNASINGTYEISIAIGGVTPVAQTFYFNDSIGGTTVANDTVLFTFDMTAAWMYDAALNMTGNVTNASSPEIYGAIGVVSIVVTECALNNGMPYCPVAAPIV